MDKPPEEGALEEGSNSQSLFKLSMESRRSSRATSGLSQTKASTLTVIDSSVDDEQACQVSFVVVTPTMQAWSFMSRSTHINVTAGGDRRADPSKGIYRDTSKAPEAKRARQMKPTTADSSSTSLFDLIEKRK